jgi:hypothetical protein
MRMRWKNRESDVIITYLFIIIKQTNVTYLGGGRVINFEYGFLEFLKWVSRIDLEASQISLVG